MNFFQIILWIILFCIYGYVNYRLVMKFDVNTKLWQNYIPIWNWFLIAKQVMTRPIIYIVSICLFSFGAMCLNSIEYTWLGGISHIIGLLLRGNLFGKVAQAMGKNYAIYSVLGCLNIVVIVILVLAFDKSRPINNNCKLLH